MKDLKALLDLMFEPEDEVSVSNSQWGYHSMPQSSVLSGEVSLVSPSQKVKTKKVKTDKLIFLCLNAVKGWRRDDCITSCRTFLWEVDVGTLSSQREYIRSLGIPCSAAIYSGNKSIHYITVLDEPVDIKTYRLLFKWVNNIGTLIDWQCGNPSRSVRIPGAIRPDTNKKQMLIEIGNRVKLDDLMAYLNKYEHLRPREREETKNDLTSENDYDKLSEWARKQFKDGIDFSKGTRNLTWFSLACDLAKSGYSENETVEILEQYFVEEYDFKYKEFITAINSGHKHMANKGQ